MNTQREDSPDSGSNWFQIGQRVRFIADDETGVIAYYMGGTWVAIKMDRGPDADGFDHVATCWTTIECIPDSEN